MRRCRSIFQGKDPFINVDQQNHASLEIFSDLAFTITTSMIVICSRTPAFQKIEQDNRFRSNSSRISIRSAGASRVQSGSKLSSRTLSSTSTSRRSWRTSTLSTLCDQMMFGALFCSMELIYIWTETAQNDRGRPSSSTRSSPGTGCCGDRTPKYSEAVSRAPEASSEQCQTRSTSPQPTWTSWSSFADRPSTCASTRTYLSQIT